MSTIADVSATIEARQERSRQLALAAARTADDNRGQDIVVLDMRGMTTEFDYFVLVTGNSRRQLHAISEEIDRVLEGELGDQRLGIEGYNESRWILLDYGSVVIHLFDAETRAYYALEDLWGQAERVPLPWQGVRWRREQETEMSGVTNVLESPCLSRHPDHSDDLSAMNILALLRDRFAAALRATGRRRGRRARPGGDGAAQPGREVRRLSGQLRDAAGQAAGQAAAGGCASSSSSGSTWPTCASRRKSPGRASSICGSRTTGSPSSLPSPAATSSGWASRRPRRRGRFVDRLLVAECRQADARRPHPLDRDRRRALPHPEVPRPPRDQRQPPRRLGHAVRDDHLRLQALRR